MSFSARQQHCLEAMGLVPWVSNQAQSTEELLLPVAGVTPALEEQATIAAAPVAGSPAVNVESAVEVPAIVTGAASAEAVSDIGSVAASEAAAVQSTVQISGQSDSGALPSDLQSLSRWLPDQPLASFLAAGKTRSVIGPEDASLLVVVQAGSGTGQEPLEGDAARLFEMMMRAINLSRRQLRMCSLASDAGITGVDAPVSQPALRDVCNPQTKAILLLLNDWPTHDDLATSQDDTVRLEVPPCPLWRIPHPDVLLHRNQLKRQAWQSLQALQRVL